MSMSMFFDQAEKRKKISHSPSRAASYGWKKIREDSEGRFEWVDKDLIFIDHSYQRDEKAIVTDIAGNFEWSSFAVVCCAERHDGLYAFDGQNRVAAALRRPEIKKVPCMIFKFDTISEEAKAFLTIQKNRKPVTAIEQYKARKISGEADVVLLDKIVLMSGYQVRSANTNYTVKCVNACLKLLKKDKEAFRDVFALAAELHGGNKINERVLQGIFYLYKATDGDIARNPLRKKLLSKSLDAIVGEIIKSIQYHGHAGERACALGILKLLNKGATVNRINLIEDDRI